MLSAPRCAKRWTVSIDHLAGAWLGEAPRSEGRLRARPAQHPEAARTLRGLGQTCGRDRPGSSTVCRGTTRLRHISAARDPRLRALRNDRRWSGLSARPPWRPALEQELGRQVLWEPCRRTALVDWSSWASARLGRVTGEPVSDWTYGQALGSCTVSQTASDSSAGVSVPPPSRQGALSSRRGVPMLGT